MAGKACLQPTMFLPFGWQIAKQMINQAVTRQPQLDATNQWYFNIHFGPRGEGYSLQWPIRDRSARKGYLFQASGK